MSSLEAVVRVFLYTADAGCFEVAPHTCADGRCVVLKVVLDSQSWAHKVPAVGVQMKEVGGRVSV